MFYCQGFTEPDIKAARDGLQEVAAVIKSGTYKLIVLMKLHSSLLQVVYPG